MAEFYTKRLIKILFIIFVFILLTTGLSGFKDDTKLVKPLLKGFNYWKWYQENTAGWKKDPNWFGAWVVSGHEDSVYIGFGSSGGTWNTGDGALLAKVNQNRIKTISKLDEQGILTMLWHDDVLYIPGADPHFGDDWDAGNFYRFIPPNDFKKFRYDKTGKPYLPNVLHLTGICVEEETGYIYTTSWGGESGDFDNYLFKSKDKGKTWEKKAVPFKGGLRRIIKYNGILYGTHETGTLDQKTLTRINYSDDDGKSWKELKSNGTPVKNISGFVIFKQKLVMLTETTGTGYSIDNTGNIEAFQIPVHLKHGKVWPTPHWFVNVENEFLVLRDYDKKLFISSDLKNWEAFAEDIHTKLKVNFFSVIGYWPDKKSLLLSVTGSWGGVWVYSLEEYM